MSELKVGRKEEDFTKQELIPPTRELWSSLPH